MSNRVMFLRTKSGEPVGCLAITLHPGDKVVEYNFSALNADKDVFNREVARQLAIGRLMENPILVPLRSDVSMFNITTAIMKNLSRRKGAPSRAVKAAKLWLKQNEQSK